MFIELRFPPVILAAAAAAVFFSVRYYLKGENADRKSLLTLFILKSAVLFMLVLAVFKPVIVFPESSKVLRKHAVLFDNSSSVPLASASDSALFRSVYRNFSDDPSFIFYKFGDSTDSLTDIGQLDFSDSFSRIDGADTERAAEKYAPESVILFTDGNFTDAGSSSLRPEAPVYVVTGSLRSEAPDLFIRTVDFEDNPAPGSEREFSVIVGYEGPAKNGEFVLETSDSSGGKVTKKARIPSPGSLTTVRFEAPPMTRDLRETVINLMPLEGEKNVKNNKKTAVQRLLRSSYKFLILADRPSLDLSFFKRLLGSNGYSYDIFYSDGLSGIKDTGKYKSLICFDLPVRNSGSVFNNIAGRFSSKLFFTGAATDLRALEEITGGRLNGRKYAAAEGRLSEVPDAGAFLLSRGAVTSDIEDIPEIIYNAALMPSEKTNEILIKAGREPKQPVLILTASESSQIFIASFRNFWKPLFGDPEGSLAAMILNLVDRTAVSGGSERIRIRPSSTEYYAGETALFSGSVLDDNLRPVKEGSVNLTVLENGLASSFSYDGREWVSKVYIPQPGVYTAMITAGEGERKIESEVKFIIRPNDLETAVTGADTTFLKSFASSRKGRIYPPDSAFTVMSERSGVFDTVTAERKTEPTGSFWYFLTAAVIFLWELALRKYKDLS